MAHEHRRLRVGALLAVLARQKTLNLVVQQEIRREAEEAGQPGRARHAREEGHGAALREAAEDDARGLDALGRLGAHEGEEVLFGAQDAGFVVRGAEVVELRL